ncbi:MAG: MlaD family protein [Limisphaerales bacterium]
MKNTLETRVGIFFVLALIAIFIILEMVGGFDFFKRGYHVFARFSDVQQLKIGDPVKMAGVPIGHVEKLGLAEEKVKVTLKLNRDAEVRTDSKATVKFTGLMGQNYVSVDFGTPAGIKAADGAFLQTEEQPDLSTLMTKLDSVASGVQNLTKSFSGDTINNLLGPVTDFLKQNTEPLGDTIKNIKTISDRLVAGQGTVGKLINDETLYVSVLGTVTNLQSTADEIKTTVADARTTLDQAKKVIEGINAGEGTLGKLAKDETLYQETAGAMTNLKEILQKINQGQGSVGKLVNDDSFLKNAKLSLQKLDKATEGLEDAGPLSILGSAVNSLF